LAPEIQGPNIAAFRQGLYDLGYVDGQTVAIEYRYGFGRSGRFPELVSELVQLKVDLLVIGSAAAALAAKNATQTMPIVFIGGSDPVERGVVASLAREAST
jgi:putative ABC transport system substrate-binding protein